jgi:hypothetical protein
MKLSVNERSQSFNSRDIAHQNISIIDREVLEVSLVVFDVGCDLVKVKNQGFN